MTVTLAVIVAVTVIVIENIVQGRGHGYDYGHGYKKSFCFAALIYKLMHLRPKLRYFFEKHIVLYYC